MLLDEPVAHELALHFPDKFDVKSTSEMGWSGTSNGELIRVAADAGFKALVTVDKNMEYQQNLKTLPITIIVLSTPQSTIDHLTPLMPEVLSVLESNPHTELIKIEPGTKKNRRDL